MIYPGFSSVISLSSLRLLVNLGVTEQERDVKQEVNISFKFYFKKKPQGCVTDNLADTVCYHEISSAVKEFCAAQSCKLLEYLCMGLYGRIKQMIPADVKIWIMVEKCNPPIDGLLGSTAFEYTDIGE